MTQTTMALRPEPVVIVAVLCWLCHRLHVSTRLTPDKWLTSRYRLHLKLDRALIVPHTLDGPEKGCSFLNTTHPGQTTTPVIADPVDAVAPGHSETPETTSPRAEHVTLLASRGGDGLGMSFKVVSNGRVFRLEPARDPDEPRFWCFRVYRCTAAGVADETERSWWGGGGMNRNDLAGAVQAIKDDPYRWLTNPSLAELHDWIMEPGSDRIEPRSVLGAPHRATR